MLWTFISCFSSASIRIEVASILFFIVNRCNILKLNDSCPLFSNLTRANDYGKWEMKTDMEHAGRVSVSSFISVKVGDFLRQILFYTWGHPLVRSLLVRIPLVRIFRKCP